jgi:hypothetical protein
MANKSTTMVSKSPFRSGLLAMLLLAFQAYAAPVRIAILGDSIT